MKVTDKLKKAITEGTIKVTIITGPDGGDCPNCPGGNAMIRQGTCPEGFEPHHFWSLGLDLKACRDCGHSVVAPMNGDAWEMPATSGYDFAAEKLHEDRQMEFNR